MNNKTQEEIKEEFLKGLDAWFCVELESFNDLLSAFLFQGLEMKYCDLEKSLDILEMSWKQIFKKHKAFILQNREHYLEALEKKTETHIFDIERKILIKTSLDT